jgi:hypothetical protein
MLDCIITWTSCKSRARRLVRLRDHGLHVCDLRGLVVVAFAFEDVANDFGVSTIVAALLLTLFMAGYPVGRICTSVRLEWGIPATGSMKSRALRERGVASPPWAMVYTR